MVPGNLGFEGEDVEIREAPESPSGRRAQEKPDGTLLKSRKRRARNNPSGGYVDEEGRWIPNGEGKRNVRRPSHVSHKHRKETLSLPIV